MNNSLIDRKLINRKIRIVLRLIKENPNLSWEEAIEKAKGEME